MLKTTACTIHSDYLCTLSHTQSLNCPLQTTSPVDRPTSTFQEVSRSLLRFISHSSIAPPASSSSCPLTPSTHSLTVMALKFHPFIFPSSFSTFYCFRLVLLSPLPYTLQIKRGSIKSCSAGSVGLSGRVLLPVSGWRTCQAVGKQKVQHLLQEAETWPHINHLTYTRQSAQIRAIFKAQLVLISARLNIP